MALDFVSTSSLSRSDFVFNIKVTQIDCYTKVGFESIQVPEMETLNISVRSDLLDSIQFKFS